MIDHLRNQLITPEEIDSHHHGAVVCRERLGGMLKYYYRAWTPVDRGLKAAGGIRDSTRHCAKYRLSIECPACVCRIILGPSGQSI
jgi:hypothetical protein